MTHSRRPKRSRWEETHRAARPHHRGKPAHWRRHSDSEPTLTKLTRATEPGAVDPQPKVWTLLDFEVPRSRADELAEALSHALLAEGGWYADFGVEDDHIVVFANKVSRYKKGDHNARKEVVAYGLSIGVPAHQLDWGD